MLSIAWKRSLTARSLYVTRRYQHSTSEKVFFLDEKALQALGADALDTTDLTLQELPSNDQPVMRGSAEANFGRKRIGCVDLPLPLIKGIKKLIDQQPDKRLVRTDALRLYESLRSTSKLPAAGSKTTNTNNSRREPRSSNKQQDQQQLQTAEPHILSYGPRESAAYTAGVLPSTYAAITNVLLELKGRLVDFEPVSLLDFGTGPGTAIWAAQNVFKGIDKMKGIDLSEDMLRTAEFLQDELHFCQHKVEFERHLNYDARQPKTDLVISAFALGDITSLALQNSTVQQLWDQTADVLVLIERGTPVGFSNIARARQYILDREKDQVHVVAPCPHDKPCPLLYSSQAIPEKFWCHFSQRVQRPSFLMKTKHSKINLEDSKYSYVILRKGVRPMSPPSTVASNDTNTSPSSESLSESAMNTLKNQAYHWPRLIQPPLKKNKHVVLDTCSPQGTIQRMVIPKSQGKIPYRDARKSAWGDAFPHESKNKVVTRIKEGMVTEEEK